MDALNSIGRLVLSAEASSIWKRHLDWRTDFGEDVFAALERGCLVPAIGATTSTRSGNAAYYRNGWRSCGPRSIACSCPSDAHHSAQDRRRDDPNRRNRRRCATRQHPSWSGRSTSLGGRRWRCHAGSRTPDCRSVCNWWPRPMARRNALSRRRGLGRFAGANFAADPASLTDPKSRSEARRRCPIPDTSRSTQSTNARVPVMAASTAFKTALEASAKKDRDFQRRARQSFRPRGDPRLAQPPWPRPPVHPASWFRRTPRSPARAAAALLTKTTSVNNAPNCSAGPMRNGLPCSTRASATDGCCERLATPSHAPNAIAIPASNT